MNPEDSVSIQSHQSKIAKERDFYELDRLEDAFDRRIRYLTDRRHNVSGETANARSYRHARQQVARRFGMLVRREITLIDAPLTLGEATHLIPDGTWPPSRYVADAYADVHFTDELDRLAMSPRDRRVLKLVAEGLPTREIAVDLGVTVATAVKIKQRTLKRARPHFTRESG